MRLLSCFFLLTAVLAGTASPQATPGPASPPASPFKLIPMNPATLDPGALLLLSLETRFAQSVASGGGKAFATWFADDAVVLNNGKPAILGRGAIAQSATWDANDYALSWVTLGAKMGPSNDMGFTWGYYTGTSKVAQGKSVVAGGRYITVWKKVADGSWKVALDASADGETAPAECCSLPKP